MWVKKIITLSGIHQIGLVWTPEVINLTYWVIAKSLDILCLLLKSCCPLPMIEVRSDKGWERRERHSSICISLVPCGWCSPWSASLTKWKRLPHSSVCFYPVWYAMCVSLLHLSGFETSVALGCCLLSALGKQTTWGQLISRCGFAV